MSEQKRAGEISPVLRWVKADERNPTHNGKWPIRYWMRCGYAEFRNGYWVEDHSGLIPNNELEWLEQAPPTPAPEVKEGISLEKVQKEIDELLSSETPESLKEWYEKNTVKDTPVEQEESYCPACKVPGSIHATSCGWSNATMQIGPEGIIITMGKEVLEANGGGAEWQKHFEGCVRSEGSGFWLHKSRNAPTQDIAMVYVIAENFVQWKVFYGGYERGPTSVWMKSGEERKIDWPRMILAGPFEKAPHKIPMRGFQGFRYVYEPIF